LKQLDILKLTMLMLSSCADQKEFRSIIYFLQAKASLQSNSGIVFNRYNPKDKGGYFDDMILAIYLLGGDIQLIIKCLN
jgi:hypothetical protein